MSETSTALPNPTAAAEIRIRDASDNELVARELLFTDGVDSAIAMEKIKKLLQEGKTIILNPTRKG